MPPAGASILFAGDAAPRTLSIWLSMQLREESAELCDFFPSRAHFWQLDKVVVGPDWTTARQSCWEFVATCRAVDVLHSKYVRGRDFMLSVTLEMDWCEELCVHGFLKIRDLGSMRIEMSVSRDLLSVCFLVYSGITV